MAVSSQIRAIEAVLDNQGGDGDELIDTLIELERVQALLAGLIAAVVRECGTRLLCTTRARCRPEPGWPGSASNGDRRRVDVSGRQAEPGPDAGDGLGGGGR